MTKGIKGFQMGHKSFLKRHSRKTKEILRDIAKDNPNVFRKGNIPWNKNLHIYLGGKKIKKGEHLSQSTQFKKGQIPHNKGKNKLEYEPLKKSSESLE